MPGPGVSAGQHGVGTVDLIAGGAEVLPDRAEVSAAGDAVLHQPCGLRLVREGAGVGVDAQRGFQRELTTPVRTKRTRLWAKTGDCGRAARQMARRRAGT